MLDKYIQSFTFIHELSLKRTGSKQEISSRKMQVKNWSILGPVTSQHHLLGVFHHIRIVSHVHVLQCCFIGQLREIPNSDGGIYGAAYEDSSLPAEGEAGDDAVVMGELGQEVTVGDVPDQNSPVAGARGYEPPVR